MTPMLRAGGPQAGQHGDSRAGVCLGGLDSVLRADPRALPSAQRKCCRRPARKSSGLRRRNLCAEVRKRWAELKAAGLLTSAGLAAAPTNNTYAPRPVIPNLPVYIAKALKANSLRGFRRSAFPYHKAFLARPCF